MRVHRSRAGRAVLTVAVMAVGVVGWSSIELSKQNPYGAARLVSIEHMPNPDICAWEPAGADVDPAVEENLLALFQPRPLYAAQGGVTTDVTRPPLRQILDSDPGYTAITVDTRRDEVFLQDANLWSIRVFNRLDNTPPTAARTEPKRVILGPNSGLQYNSGLYVDPQSGELYSVENDTGDAIAIYAPDAKGDSKPIRELEVTHYGYAMAVDEAKQELFLSVHAPPRVEVYRKSSSGQDKPLRVLEGAKTGMADVHGIAIDVKNNLLLVNNWGNYSDYRVTGGRFESPSISIFPMDAQGDVAPMRVIQGPKTQLNWPGAMYLDPGTGDLFVANNVGQSILVFRGTDNGDVAPARMLKGNMTGLSYPMGVFVDATNRELWVSNLGNASATVYSLNANGNVAPLRTIRSAPLGKKSLRFGKAVSVAYDSKREEILVPN